MLIINSLTSFQEIITFLSLDLKNLKIRLQGDQCAHNTIQFLYNNVEQQIQSKTDKLKLYFFQDCFQLRWGQRISCTRIQNDQINKYFFDKYSMARGPKKHLKRINTPNSWMLSKMGGIYATRPSQGPHKLRDCLPLAIVLKNRLRLALTSREANLIVQDKESGIKIDNKVRRDIKFPVGVMDVITVVKTNENYRLLYDIKGRIIVHKIKDTEAKFKLLKIKTKAVGPNKVPYVVTSDGRTIRFPHPEIEEGDTIKLDLEKNQITEWVKDEAGHLAYITGGNNIGRVGQILHVERHLGSFDIVHLKDANGKTFATRKTNVFLIGNKKPLISLPEGDGKYLNILEEKALREDKKRKPSTK